MKNLNTKTLVISLLFAANLAFANNFLPSENHVKNMIMKSKALTDDDNKGSQLLEMADIKIVIPAKDLPHVKQDKCVVLLHAQKNIKNIREASNYLSSNKLSGNGQCDLLDHAKNQISKHKKKSSGWNFSFHFGFTRTTYDNTDMRIKSDRVDVLIKDFEFDERTSASFYNPANWESWMDAFRWIDEPTNHFVLTAEKNGHSIILSVFHPKFLKKKYQTKHVTGVVDGVTVDQFMDINEEFDGYNNQVGEMYLVRFENTHMQMAWQLGYGYEIKLIDSQKFGTFSVRPAVLIGVMSGMHYDVYIQEGEYWEFDDYKDQHKIQGPMASVGLRVNYKIKNFNLFVDGKYSYAQLKHGYGDPNGYAEYDLSYKALTFGIGYTLPTGKNKKKKRKPIEF